MPLDLTLAPLYRVDGKDQPSLPGLMAASPPRKTARGRDQDRLIVYLNLTGNAVFSTGDYLQFVSQAAVTFYATPGTFTAALRAAADSINQALLERNMSTSGRGQYAAGLLALAAIRGSQVTLLLSGAIHVFVLGSQSAQEISDTLSGRGLGLSQALPHYFSQISLRPNDRILFCGKPPLSWEPALRDSSPASLEATRRRLMTLTTEDLQAALLCATNGTGLLTVLRPAADAAMPEAAGAGLTSKTQGTSIPDEQASLEAGSAGSPPGAHFVQPSAYSIPPETKEEIPPAAEIAAPAPFLSSLPRARSAGAPPAVSETELPDKVTLAPREPSALTRQTAKKLAGGIQASRQGIGSLGTWIRNFLPRMLPGSERTSVAISSTTMVFIAVLIPVVVVTVASVVYFRYGRSVQYEEYLLQAQDTRNQAVGLSDPAVQGAAWQRELFYLDKADSYSQTNETKALRQEAQTNLDQLQGILRLQFQPVLNAGVGVQIGRLAANENDLYLLDAQRGGVLRIALTSGGYQQDASFNCSPGSFGGYTVGPMVDILALPAVNSMNGAVLGVDAGGNLLYCSPGNVAQAIPLPPPDTNWGRVKAFTLDSGNLYVLDAQSRAVWVYVGKDGTFVDRPYFFFGGQIPSLDDAIDLAVSGDDLYILHSDGHLSTCSYSRIQSVPTRCVDPAPMLNPLPAYKDINLFTQAHFTQMMISPAPDSTLLLLDSDGQGIFRFSAHSLELQSQLRPLPGPTNPLPQGPVGAMTVSPNHILLFAIQDKVYFATSSP
jgi:hypothetical protein